MPSKSKVKIMWSKFLDMRTLSAVNQNQQVHKGTQLYLSTKGHNCICPQRDTTVSASSSNGRHRYMLWDVTLWLLCHDNMSAHNAMSTQQFLVKKNITGLRNLGNHPYYPNMALKDYSAFSKFKVEIKGVHFEYTNYSKKSDVGIAQDSRRIPAIMCEA